MLRFLLMFGAVWAPADTIPEPVEIVPLVVEETLALVFRSEPRPDQRPLTIHVGSFVNELARVSERPVSANELIELFEQYGAMPGQAKSPFCEGCDYSKGPVMWLKIANLQRTQSGYTVEVWEEHPYMSYEGSWKRAFSVTPYEFVWTGETWESRVSGPVIRS